MHGTAVMALASGTKKLGLIGPVIGNDCAPVTGLVPVGSPSGFKQPKTVGDLPMNVVAMANCPSGLTVAPVSFCPNGMLLYKLAGGTVALPAEPPITAGALPNGATNRPPLTPVTNSQEGAICGVVATPREIEQPRWLK